MNVHILPDVADLNMSINFDFVDTWNLIRKIYSSKNGHYYWSLFVNFMFEKFQKNYNLYLPDLAECARLLVVKN